MGNEIYLIFKRDNKVLKDYKGSKCNSVTPIGSVLYDDSDGKLIVDVDGKDEVEFDNVMEIIKYVEEKNDWFLCDMQGDLYDLKNHMLLVENINKIGFGYIVR